MTDQELDSLFSESAKRQQPIAQINANVMRTVRRDLRIKTIRKWARLVGGCFGVPLALVLYGFALHEAMSGTALQTPLRVACIALPLIALAVLSAAKLKNFRLDM